MDEPEVSALTLKWLEERGYTVKTEVGVSGTEREVILDYFAFTENAGTPEILWIECKGDVSLSMLLEGFIRTEFAIFLGGGKGILSCPTNAIQKLLKYKNFLEQAKDVIKILDIEKNILHQM